MSNPKMRNAETGCGTALIVISAIIIAVCIVALTLFLARIFGLWPDWAIEFELLVKAWFKAMLK